MPICKECGKPVKEGDVCLPCKLEQEEIDKEETEVSFQVFKKEKPKWK